MRWVSKVVPTDVRPPTAAPRSAARAVMVDASISPFASPSTREPDRHSRLEPRWIALWIEAQPQCVAIMIANHALGLPGGKRPQGSELCHEGRYHRLRA